MDLKQSTAVTIKMGPFVDSVDGNTDETGLTIQKADVRLSKNGGNMAAANSNQGVGDAGAAYDEIGYYDISLDTTDTGTLGRLEVMIHKTGALHSRREFNVIHANEWDKKYNTGNFAGSVASVTGAVGSVTGAVGSVTGAVASVTAGVSLADDAITSAKFDESTAYPVKSADTGVTQIARVGADSDTLETLSDEIAAAKTILDKVDDMITTV